MAKNRKSIISLTLLTVLLAGCAVNGKDGEQGPKGNDGEPGKSAYELYCEKHPEYKGTLEEWLDEFFEKDETDYTKYDDFLFSEVTYSGVAGYSANYIGSKNVIVFPETFKNLPVLLATINESVFAPNCDSCDTLPSLEKIYLPDSIKVVSISESIKTRYEISRVSAYVSGSLDRFDAPFYPYDVYYEKGLLEDYRKTNLRKYFSFSNVYVKNGESYSLAVNRVDKITEFITQNYLNEGGIYDQIIDLMGGENFYRFGSFEFAFPKKFTVNFDGFDINVPLNFVNHFNEFDINPGISFENNVLKGDATKYGDKIGYEITAYIDLGIQDIRLNGVSFHLFKDASKIVIGDSGVLNRTTIANFLGGQNISLKEGSNSISVYCGDQLATQYIPLKCAPGLDCEIKSESSRTSLNIKEAGSYDVAINLNNFEMLIKPESFDADVHGAIFDSFLTDNGFVGSQGVIVGSKELNLPSKKQIEIKGIKYDVDLSYVAQPSICAQDMNGEHPTIFYNEERDNDKVGYHSIIMTVEYSIANDFLNGTFMYQIYAYKYDENLSVGLNVHVDDVERKSFNLIHDTNPELTSKGVYRLNDVDINGECFAITINGREVIYELAEGSIGSMKKGYYSINSGLYNITVDIETSTILIEESDGHLTKLVKYEFFNYLKTFGFNIYVDESKDSIVFFDDYNEGPYGKNLRIYYNNQYFNTDFQILNELGMLYTEMGDSDSGYLVLQNQFNAFEKKGAEVGVLVSLKSDRLFLNYNSVMFNCIFRHIPTTMELGQKSYSRIENNIVYFDGFTFTETYYALNISPNSGNEASFKFMSMEGAMPNLDAFGLTVPSEMLGHTYNISFNLNTMIVNFEKIS